jgi:acyl-coenzyme A synthetase/AMP-(fatty) acid ligase
MLNPFRFTEFNALSRPTRLAFDDGLGVFTWRQFQVITCQVAAKLAALGVRPGQLVVTALPAGLDWIFTNALFHEACITCSVVSQVALDPALDVDWIIAQEGQSGFPAEKLIIIDKPWLADLKKFPVTAPREYADADAFCRLVLTSGTTGFAKAAPFSVRQLDNRLRSLSAYWSAGGGEFNLMSLMTVGGFMTAMAGAFTGNAYFAPSAPDPVALIHKHGIRNLLGSPTQLAKFQESVRRSGRLLPSVQEVRSAGGPFPMPLVKALRELLPQAELYNIYGSTEVGGLTLCTVNPEYTAAIAGFPLETADIEIVDDNDQPLPPGDEGHLRVRTRSMVAGYYRNPEASARFFRDGWFYPGDRGRLMPNRLLILSGRAGELINKGGVKVNPAALDEFLLAYPGLTDAAAFALVDGNGLPQVAAALVAPADFDRKQLRADMLKSFGMARTPQYFFMVPQIPRNAMGKVMRVRLSQSLSQALRERAGEIH